MGLLIKLRKIPPVTRGVTRSGGPLWGRFPMDDDDDGVVWPMPSCWSIPFGDMRFDPRVTHAPGPSTVPGLENLPSTCMAPQNHHPALFQGNSGFHSNLPALFETLRGGEERQSDGERADGQNKREEEEEAAPVERQEEAGPEVSVEILIGRKLREIGDEFEREHLQQIIQHQRLPLPGWWHLMNVVFDFLFPRGAAPLRDQR